MASTDDLGLQEVGPNPSEARPSGAPPSERSPSDSRPDRVDISLLVYLRIAVGITICFWAKSFLDNNLYAILFQQPRFLFKYAGFEWVKLWPGDGIYWHFVITMIAGIFMAVGFLTRISAAILCASIAYVLLVERSIYVNHYYLLSCVAGLFVFLPSDRAFSIDRLLGISRHQQTFARWQLWLLRFQFGIPYVFGAIAKLNLDWFGGQPSGIILSRYAQSSPLGDWLTRPGMAELMSYGGFFYDLLIVPMLLYRRTRLLGVLFSLCFHLTNSILLTIGVFPWFMLATLIIFFPSDSVTKLWNWLVGIRIEDIPRRVAERLPSKYSLVGRLGIGLAITYVIVQLLLPVRPWVLPGNASWNERGQRFAWRMMLRDKVTLTHFKVTDTNTGEYLFLPSHTVLTGNQMLTAERNPELIRQAAFGLEKLAKGFGVEECEIQCLALVSLNGRRPVPMIDPSVNLLQVERDWFVDEWVTPSPGRLPDRIWNHNTETWWQELTLPESFKPLQGRTPTELREYLGGLGAPAGGTNERS